MRILICFFLAGCLPFWGFAQAASLTIQGTIEFDPAARGASNPLRESFVKLDGTHADGSSFRDTAYIHNNRYRFTVRLQDEGAIEVNLFWYKKAGELFDGFAQFYAGPGKVKVMHRGEFKHITVSGSLVQTENEVLRQLRRPADRQLFIHQHPDSWMSYVELSRLVVRCSADTAAALYAALSPRLRQFPVVTELGKRIDGMKVAVGMHAPDFAQPDTSGRSVSLSSLRGKYVLIDFWASWCHSCRAENSFLVPDYNKYKDRGFEILGVSLDAGPMGRQLWLKAILQDKAPWIQISDLKAFENTVAVRYGISAIPQNFLVDPNGKIIAKNLDERTLPQTLDAVLPR